MENKNENRFSHKIYCERGDPPVQITELSFWAVSFRPDNYLDRLDKA